MKKSFEDAIRDRRTIYHLGAETGVPDRNIITMLEYALTWTPTAFNCQSARALLLVGKSHSRLWEIVRDTLAARIPPENFAPTAEKISWFAAAHGTVLYWDDTAVTEELARQFPTYKAQFPVWADQANGMLQFVVWTLLEEAGLGANLQHYNPLIDEEVRREFAVPQSWRLIAEMPFGARLADPDEKTFVPAEQRLKVCF